MKKLIGLLLSMMMLVILSVPVHATRENLEFGKEQDSKYQGLYMSYEKFNELYGEKYSKTKIASTLAHEDMTAYFTVDDIQVDGGNISVTADVYYNNESKKLEASGKLFNGYKKHLGQNSIVADMNDQNSLFNILLFEIYNDTKPDNTLMKKELENKPHIKMYLADENKNILLFEFGLPGSLANISVESAEAAESTKDLFWFVDVIKPKEVEEVPVDKNMLEIIKKNKSNHAKLSSSYRDWTYPKTYKVEYVIGGVEYADYSLPWGTFKVTNVGTSASIWTHSFKIAEHVTANGKTVPGQNLFKYKDVKLATGVGAYTSIERAIIDGRMAGSGDSGKIIMRIADKVWKKTIPVLPTLTEIYGWIKDAQTAFQEKEVKLGGDDIRLSTDPTIISTVSSGKNVLHKNYYEDVSEGHFLVLQTDVQFNDFNRGNATVKEKTKAVLKVDWDVYLSDKLHQSSGYSIEYEYNVSNM